MKRATLYLLLFGIPLLVAGLVVVTAMPAGEQRNPGSAEVQNEPGEVQPEWELIKRNSRGPVVPHPQDPEVLFHPTGGGLWKSTDGGDSWQRHDEEGCCGGVQSMMIHPEYPDTMLIAGGVSGVLLSTDAGESWQRANGGIGRMHHGYNVTDVAYHRKQGAYYAANRGAGYEAIYRSKDEQPWEMIKRGSPHELHIDQETGNIYAAARSVFLKSTDGGESWEEKDEEDGLPEGVRSLTQVPDSRTLYTGTIQGIYKSYDEGESWFSVNDSMTVEHRINDIVVPEADTNQVFAGANVFSRGGEDIVTGGIFISSDGGDKWQRYNHNLPDTSLGIGTIKLSYIPHSESLFASIKLIDSRGDETHLFRLSEPSVVGINDDNPEHPENYRLRQNYPNPFNATTTIDYQLPESGHVELAIYDLLGRRITTLVNEPKEAGRHTAQFHAGELASGTYIYRLEAGSYVESRQMTLIK